MFRTIVCTSEEDLVGRNVRQEINVNQIITIAACSLCIKVMGLETKENLLRRNED